MRTSHISLRNRNIKRTCAVISKKDTGKKSPTRPKYTTGTMKFKLVEPVLAKKPSPYAPAKYMNKASKTLLIVKSSKPKSWKMNRFHIKSFASRFSGYQKALENFS